MKKELRILQICSKRVFPAQDGGAMVMADLALRMAERGHEVTQLVMVTPKQFSGFGEAHLVPSQERIKVVAASCDTRTRVLGALANLFFTRIPYHVERHQCATLSERLRELLARERFDIIQIESVYLWWLTPTVRNLAPNVRIVLRIQNIEHRIWEGLARTARAPFSWYLGLQADRIRRHEKACFRDADHVLALTGPDADTVRAEVAGANVELVGMSIPYYPPCEGQPSSSKDFFHLGAMDWLPNREGVRWFMKEVWPSFRSIHPHAAIHLAGFGMPGDLRAYAGGKVRVSDAIEDPIAFMNTSGIMVVPLLSGSGIRVKILQGMALGKTIIATPLAASGIGLTDGQHILLASTAEEFIGQMCRCMVEPAIVQRLGNAARDFARKEFSSSAIADQLEDFYGSVVASNAMQTI